MIMNVAFRGDVAISVGGKFTTLGSWERHKHAAFYEVEHKDGSPYMFLYILDAKGERTGRRKRIPMTSVSYIDEEPPKPEPVKVGK